MLFFLTFYQIWKIVSTKLLSSTEVFNIDNNTYFLSSKSAYKNEYLHLSKKDM